MSSLSTFFAGLTPKSKREAALYVFVFFCALRPWIFSWIAFPHDPPGVRTIYRCPEGDYEYFYLINSLATGNLGENAVYESQHTGVQSFPVFSIIFHVLTTALLGSLGGYILADIILTALFFFSFRAWCRLFSPDALWTSFLAALFVTGLPGITDGYPHFFHWGQLWGFRIPRPFITDIYLVAGLVLFIRMVWQPETRNRLSSWALIGALMAISLQSLIYYLPTFGIGAVFIALFWLANDRPSLRRVASSLVCCLGTFLILSTPFIYQRLHESPEITARLGLFPVDPWRIWFHTPWWKDIALRAGLIILVLLAALNASAKRANLAPIPPRVLGLMATLQITAYFAIPLSSLSGKLIQAYHFFGVTAAIQTCLLVALVSRDGPRFLPQLLRQPLLAVLLLILGYGLIPYHIVHRHLLEGPIRIDMYHPPGPNYHRAFSALARELDRDQYKDDLVAATTDNQVSAYWVDFHHRFAFMPEVWTSTLSNQQIEDRVLWFAREEGMDAPALARFLDEETTLLSWLSHDRDQCGPLYHKAPLEDYSAADAAMTQGPVNFNAFSLALPLSENIRLQNRYAQILAMDESQRPRLDLIILSADKFIPALPAPDSARYALTYHDDYFRVYQAIRK